MQLPNVLSPSLPSFKEEMTLKLPPILPPSSLGLISSKALIGSAIRNGSVRFFSSDQDDSEMAIKEEKSKEEQVERGLITLVDVN